jgi:glycosyltransferase involved in cell wall biosynthesis
VVREAHRFGVPVVQTVHNHRHSCVRGSYFRDGHPCHECQQKRLPWPAVVHGCYRDSRLQSAAMVTALTAHRGDQAAVDRYIALSEPIAESLSASGWVEPGRIVVRPNSVPDPGPTDPPGSGLLFVGRLTREKGVHLLLDAWRRTTKGFTTLTFVGDGPAREAVETAAEQMGSGVLYAGRMDPAGVSTALRACAALVIPSIAPEALPLVVLEAFAHGRPVLATNSGGLTSVVGPSVGWLTTTSTADLAATLDLASVDNHEQLGSSARERYEREFAPHVVITRQIQIYSDVIAATSRSPREDGRREHRRR